MSNEISPMRRMNELITSGRTGAYLASVLGSQKSERFKAALIGMFSQTPALQKCEPTSVMFAALKAAALNLPVGGDLGFAYVVPYGTAAQFQLGYRGLYQLALRTGKFVKINVTDVKEGELSQDLLTGEICLNAKVDRTGLPTVGYVAFFELTNGFRKSLYMSCDEIKAHALRFSQTAKRNQGLWISDFEKMAKKTVLKLLLSRFAPISIDDELSNGILNDQKVFSNDENGKYSDNSDFEFSQAETVEILENNINEKIS